MARPKDTKYIETPEALLLLWEQYKEDVKAQSKEWTKIQYVGKDGERVEDGMKVPLTMEGFRRFGHKNGVTIKNYFDNVDDRYKNYYTICSCIKDEIRENQIIGGLLGLYNPSITQRLNGLVDKQQIETIKEQPLFPDEKNNTNT